MTEQKYCPDTNLVWAILCTLLCCLPFGIVAIVKASSVEKLWYQGRHDEAIKAASDAKKYSIWGAVSYAIFLAIFVVVYVIAIACACMAF